MKLNYSEVIAAQDVRITELEAQLQKSTTEAI